MEIKPFKRVYHIGSLPDWNGLRMAYFVRAELSESGELSLQAVEGLLHNGDCRGSCGQASDGLRSAELKPAEGWTKAKARRLADIWEAWHLNHLRACDSAMERDGWHKRASEPMLGYHFGLSSEAWNERRAAEAAALAALRGGAAFQPSERQAMIAALPLSYVQWTKEGEPVPEPAAHYVPAAPRYGQAIAPERKTLGWLSPSEHSEGLLGRVHPESGNGYGSQWYKAEVPAEVIAELESFPAYASPLSWFDWLGEGLERIAAEAFGRPIGTLTASERSNATSAWRDGQAAARGGRIWASYQEGTPSGRIYAKSLELAKESADVL